MEETNHEHHSLQKDRELMLAFLQKEREVAFKRFPFLFTLLGSFGLVATFYGFEGLIDQVPFFNNNPVLILITGLIILLLTGGLYKKLGE